MTALKALALQIMSHNSPSEFRFWKTKNQEIKLEAIPILAFPQPSLVAQGQLESNLPTWEKENNGR